MVINKIHTHRANSDSFSALGFSYKLYVCGMPIFVYKDLPNDKTIAKRCHRFFPHA